MRAQHLRQRPGAFFAEKGWGPVASISKMVSDRADISHAVVSSLTVHGTEIAAEAEQILFPDGLPKHLTVAQLFAALAGALDRSVTELTAADLANAQELSDDDAPRAARDAGVIDVRDRLINARGVLSSVYGAAILKAYGLGGETPDDPQQLVHRATNAATLLTTRALTEKAKQEGVAVDAKAIGRALAAAVKQLEAALGDVQREEREAQLTLKRRNAAMTAWNAHYQGVADVVTGFFELTGRADLAELVRPTVRRRAGLTDAADATPGDAASNGAAAKAPAAQTPAAQAGAGTPPIKVEQAGPDAVLATQKPVK
jgi:hypothetical protein